MQSVIMLKEQFAFSRNVIVHANDSEAKLWTAKRICKESKTISKHKAWKP